ncbi:MAG: type VII toxin-antitoxin system MntA family adenylyltransferase antitoxin, partial [Pseudonocardiaceae bacterium]
ERTVVFRLKYPYAPFAQRLLLGVVPRQALYWGGAPAVKAATLVFVTDDNARATRMAAGEFDATVLPPKLAKTYTGRDGYQVIRAQSADYRGLGIPSELPFTSDTRVRQAINVGINRQAMIDTVLAGAGKPAATPISPYLSSHDVVLLGRPDRRMLSVPRPPRRSLLLRTRSMWRDRPQRGSPIPRLGGHRLCNSGRDFLPSTPRWPRAVIRARCSGSKRPIVEVSKAEFIAYLTPTGRLAFVRSAGLATFSIYHPTNATKRCGSGLRYRDRSMKWVRPFIESRPRGGPRITTGLPARCRVRSRSPRRQPRLAGRRNGDCIRSEQGGQDLGEVAGQVVGNGGHDHHPHQHIGCGCGGLRRRCGRVRSGSMSASAADRVLANAGVRFAYLFGSRATGRHRPTSDADVAIMPGEPLDLLAEARLSDRLAQALQVPTVDLVDLRRAPLRVRGRVLSEARLLYSGDEPGRVAFEVRTRSEYFDFLPTQRAHRDEFLRRVAAKGLDG